MTLSVLTLLGFVLWLWVPPSPSSSTHTPPCLFPFSFPFFFFSSYFFSCFALHAFGPGDGLPTVSRKWIPTLKRVCDEMH